MSANKSTLAGEAGQDEAVERTASLGPPVQITLKPGWKKTEGQFTFIFTVVAALLSIFGFKYSPEKVETMAQAVQTGLQTLGPLAAIIPVLHKYIGARSQVTRAATLATAHMQTGAPIMAQGFDVGGLLSGIGGGSGIKDPNTYLGIAKIIGNLAGGKTGQAIDKITGSSGSIPSDFQAQVEAGFKQIVGTIQADEKIIVGLWNTVVEDKPAKTIEDVRAYTV